jgi:hypothetical protein
MGERGVFLKNGDGEGFNLIDPKAGLIVLGLAGVDDIASSKTVVEEVCDGFQTSQEDVIALGALAYSEK